MPSSIQTWAEPKLHTSPYFGHLLVCEHLKLAVWLEEEVSTNFTNGMATGVVSSRACIAGAGMASLLPLHPLIPASWVLEQQLCLRGQGWSRTGCTLWCLGRLCHKDRKITIKSLCTALYLCLHVQNPPRALREGSPALYLPCLVPPEVSPPEPS